MSCTLREDWYAREIEAALDLDQSGIYEWRIEGVGVYVGKALRLKSRLRAYPNNVRRMLQGLHWHSDPTRDYRPIHHAPAQCSRQPGRGCRPGARGLLAPGEE